MIIMASRQLVQVGYTILGLLCVLCSQVFIKALHLYYDYGFFYKGHHSSIKLEQIRIESWDQCLLKFSVKILTKRNDSVAISFNVFSRFSYIVLFTMMETAKLLLFLAIYLDFTKNSQGRNLKWALYIF